MQILRLQYILIYISVLHFTRAKFDEYVDLLDLADNDEFQWGAKLSNNSNFQEQHTLNKRQVIPAQQTLLENKDYGPCRTPLGDTGRCRHIIYCRMPELKDDVWRLVSQLCIIEKSSIGICCTDRMTSNRFSPHILQNPNDEPAGRIVNHPEHRGCGITTRQFPRITGGRLAEPDEWPWMAAILKYREKHVWCGGVLITDRHVLTAAHCLYTFKTAEMFVRLGEYNTHELNETRARDFRIANSVMHVDYDPLTFENDIGLLRIERGTLFNTYIWPVCMPPLNEEWEGRVGIVTGWGTQSFGGPHSTVLMEVSLPIWKLDDCKQAMVERIPDTVLCAGRPEGGQDSCQGDSGGPLLVQLPNHRWVAIGIVSWGVRCGEANRPGMYTRVDKYLDWIISNADI